MDLTKELADTLCAVIALGFVKKHGSCTKFVTIQPLI
jgi:hypothetical protein